MLYERNSETIMIAHHRHRAILAALKAKSAIGFPDLRQLLGVSAATIRRDLSFLESIGKVARTHGGVVRPEPDGELSFDRKSRAALAAKLAIARAAAELVRPGHTIYIDAGTTALEVGRRVLQREDVTVYTNSIPLLVERAARGTRLISIGGEVRSISLALVNAGAWHWVQRARFDWAFLGTSGIDPAEGATTTELSEATLKSAVLTHAKRVALVADKSKWDQPASLRFAAWSDIHQLFTDAPLTRVERATLSRHGTEVNIVGRP